MLTRLIAAVLLLSAISAPASAQVIGKYDRITTSQFLAMKNPPYVYAGKEYQFDSWVCRDIARDIPGKIVHGYCFVPWDGKEYKNTEYYALRVPILADDYWRKSFDWTKAVTYAAGAGVYHCRVDSFDSAGKFTHTIAGAFYEWERVCIVPWGGKAYRHYLDYPSANRKVLILHREPHDGYWQ